MRAAVCMSLLLSLMSPAMAEHDDDDERRERKAPKVKYENNHERYKYEYRDRYCKYEYEYKYRSGKVKVEQEGDCRHVVMAQPVRHGEPLPRAIPPEPDAHTIECNREVLGAILGGMVGATVGSRIGDEDTRAITTAGGAVIGAVIGGAVGRTMDQEDQACAAQAMEYAKLQQSVTWSNPANRISYTITPTEVVRSSKGGECRRYILRTSASGAQRSQRGTACREKNGAWAVTRS